METVDANGITIAFDRVGSGPPLLLLHGAEADRTMFAGLASLLAPQRTVIAMDQRDSGGTRNPEAPYGLDDLADDCAGLVEALRLGPVDVFGQSLGGVIAQAFAARHPGLVQRLVLGSTFQLGADPVAASAGGVPRLLTLRAGLPGTARDLAGMFFTDAYLERHPERAALLTGTTRTPAQQARRGTLLLRPVSATLADVRAPTLVVAGAVDRLIPPAHTLGIAAAIAGAQTLLLDDLGHVAVLEAPERVAQAILAFLTSTGGGAAVQTEA
ncbi:alpha/beta fold hydrolase [Zavarzinia sp. CC-PAN008]|uniref:alpha/beta fold hydrolase n=1 Tax=Zavarzinia sp. CC-PAN008 TaxID=3243332 RepID=UPI003F749FA1